MSKRAAAVAIGAMVFLLVTDGAYALLRLGSAVGSAWAPMPDGAGLRTYVDWSVHVAMFWRLGMGAYGAGMAALLAFLATRENVARAARVLDVLALAVAALAVVQGLAFP